MKIDQITTAAWCAELTATPAFRIARNHAFEATGDADATAFHVVQEALGELETALPPNVGPAWDLKRRLALAPSIGAFAQVIAELPCEEASLSTATKDDLDGGQPGPVSTNSRLKNMEEAYADPTQFILRATNMLQARANGELGPENYATALFYYLRIRGNEAMPKAEMPAVAREAIERLCEGFGRIAETDAPNFIELTNIYKAMTALPKGSFPENFSNVIIRHSLEQLPTFNDRAMRALMQAFPNFNLQGNETRAAALLELSIYQMPAYERVANLKSSLRSVAKVLAECGGVFDVNRALPVLLDKRNNVDEAVGTLQDMSDINRSLARITQYAELDNNLHAEIATLAEGIARKAIGTYNTEVNKLSKNPEAQEAYRRAHKSIVDGIVNDWSVTRPRTSTQELQLVS